MRFIVKFYKDKKIVFSKEVITDNLSKLMLYVSNTRGFLNIKHSSVIDYEVIKI